MLAGRPARIQSREEALRLAEVHLHNEGHLARDSGRDQSLSYFRLFPAIGFRAVKKVEEVSSIRLTSDGVEMECDR